MFVLEGKGGMGAHRGAMEALLNEAMPIVAPFNNGQVKVAFLSGGGVFESPLTSSSAADAVRAHESFAQATPQLELQMGVERLLGQVLQHQQRPVQFIVLTDANVKQQSDLLDVIRSVSGISKEKFGTKQGVLFQWVPFGNGKGVAHLNGVDNDLKLGHLSDTTLPSYDQERAQNKRPTNEFTRQDWLVKLVGSPNPKVEASDESALKRGLASLLR